jgi:hypothetical protein
VTVAAVHAIEKKRVSLKAMLRWSYGQQMVHLREQGEDRDHILLSADTADSAARVMMRAAVGIGRGTVAAIPLEFHKDAERLHDAVLALPAPFPSLIIGFGRTGWHPEPCEVFARPQRFLPNIGNRFERPGDELVERRGMGYWQGEFVLYRIAAKESVVERVPIYAAAGRGRVKQVAVEEVRTPVEFCPVEWWPDPAYVRAVNAIAESWARAIALLTAALAAVAFQDHEIAARDSPLRNESSLP